MTEVTLQVEGMSCGHCKSSVEGAVESCGANGVVDLAAKTVQIAYDEGKVSLDAIKAAIEDQGYDVVGA